MKNLIEKLINEAVSYMYNKGKVRVLVTRRDGVQQHYWVSQDKLEEFKRRHEERGEKVEVESYGVEEGAFRGLSFDKIFETMDYWFATYYNEYLDSSEYEDVHVNGQEIRIFTLNSLIGRLAEYNWKKSYYWAKEFFKSIVEEKYAKSLAKAWVLWRLWMSGKFGSVSGYIDEKINRARGLKVPVRKASPDDLEYLDKDVEWVIRSTRMRDLVVYKKFSEELFYEQFGGNAVLYRGVSRLETMMMGIGLVITGSVDKKCKIFGNVTSFSLSDTAAKSFGMLVKARVRPEDVWATYISASEHYLGEYEIVVGLPEEGLDVEIIDEDLPDTIRDIMFLNEYEKGNKKVDVYIFHVRFREMIRHFFKNYDSFFSELFSKMRRDKDLVKNLTRMYDMNEFVDKLFDKLEKFAGYLTEERFRDFAHGDFVTHNMLVGMASDFYWDTVKNLEYFVNELQESSFYKYKFVKRLVRRAKMLSEKCRDMYEMMDKVVESMKEGEEK